MKETASAIERRLTTHSIELGAIFAIAAAGLNLALAAPALLVHVCWISGAILLLLAWGGRRGWPTEVLYFGFLAVVGVLLGVTWEANGGIRGSTTIGLVTAMVYAVLAAPARHSHYAIAGVLLFFFALLTIELSDGVPAPSPFQGWAEAMDHGMTALMLVILSGVGVAAMRRAYEDTLARLEAANRQVGELAERALGDDREKSRFLAQVSHELRTPLAAVLGSLEVAARAPNCERLASVLGAAQRRCSDLKAIIDDLVELSSLEDFGRGRREAPVALAELIGGLEAQTTMAPGVRYTSSIAADLPAWVRLEAQHVRRALSHLLDNAAKHTDHGVIRLEVHRRGDELEFRVVDSGAGIAPEDLPHLGQAFMQLPEGRRRGGSGLGLYIVRRTAQRLGGRFELESTVGVGTMARLVLPLIPDSAPAPEARDAPAPHAPLRVLIADDDPLLLDVLGAMLSQFGHHVDGVGDGAEALERCHREHYDAVVLDLQMPKIDGCEAARRLRASHPELALVGLSASALASDVAAGLAAGMDVFLSKPIAAAELQRAILGAWRQHRRPAVAIG